MKWYAITLAKAKTADYKAVEYSMDVPLSEMCNSQTSNIMNGQAGASDI
jgi:hypothetical protein